VGLCDKRRLRNLAIRYHKWRRKVVPYATAFPLRNTGAACNIRPRETANSASERNGFRLSRAKTRTCEKRQNVVLEKRRQIQAPAEICRY